MDVHVRRAITEGLRLRGVDVITAQEDDSSHLKDPELLDRAGNLQRILFSQDADLLREANRRQQAGEQFVGVVYAHQLNITIAECITDLELISKSSNLDDCMNHVTFLPL
jgi:predicted nuclease of predicted toxin-antitoxin system